MRQGIQQVGPDARLRQQQAACAREARLWESDDSMQQVCRPAVPGLQLIAQGGAVDEAAISRLLYCKQGIGNGRDERAVAAAADLLWAASPCPLLSCTR